MSTPTITEFLVARIAEDEARARAASTGPWFRDSGWSISAPSPEGWDGPYVVVETPRARNDSEFVARHDPARVLAECAAKRALMTVADDAENYGDHVMILFAVAAVYKDHPDYQQDWAL